MTGRAATRYARWVVISVLALFVIDIAVPHGAKPWVLVCMAVAIVILLLVLGACWLRGSVIRKAGAAGAGHLRGVPVGLDRLLTLAARCCHPSCWRRISGDLSRGSGDDRAATSQPLTPWEAATCSPAVVADAPAHRRLQFRMSRQPVAPRIPEGDRGPGNAAGVLTLPAVPARGQPHTVDRAAPRWPSRRRACPPSPAPYPIGKRVTGDASHLGSGPHPNPAAPDRGAAQREPKGTGSLALTWRQHPPKLAAW